MSIEYSLDADDDLEDSEDPFPDPGPVDPKDVEEEEEDAFDDEEEEE